MASNRTHPPSRPSPESGVGALVCQICGKSEHTTMITSVPRGRNGTPTPLCVQCLQTPESNFVYDASDNIMAREPLGSTTDQRLEQAPYFYNDDLDDDDDDNPTVLDTGPVFPVPTDDLVAQMRDEYLASVPFGSEALMNNMNPSSQFVLLHNECPIIQLGQAIGDQSITQAQVERSVHPITREVAFLVKIRRDVFEAYIHRIANDFLQANPTGHVEMTPQQRRDRANADYHAGEEISVQIAEEKKRQKSRKNPRIECPKLDECKRLDKEAEMDKDANYEDCVVCMERPASAILLDCLHQRMCFQCSYDYVKGKRQGEKQCPICKEEIRKVKTRIYK